MMGRGGFGSMPDFFSVSVAMSLASSSMKLPAMIAGTAFAESSAEAPEATARAIIA